MSHGTKAGPARGAGEMSVEDSRRLASCLLRETVLGHPVPAPELIETHISIVALSGPFAYKLRKPVKLPFLDFRTLAARKEDCEQELALNRRWAAELYLEVVPITGSPDAPRIGGEGPVLDYAVRMRQFPHSDRLDRVAAAGGLDAQRVLALADCAAQMHREAPRAGADSAYGGAHAIRAQVMGNLDALRARCASGQMAATLAELTRFSIKTLESLDEVFRLRKEQGQVRECHGDLHLANLIRIEDRVVAFDGVEFEPDFRWVDVISDLAFLIMDLRAHALAPLDFALLDRYLQHTGDYGGLRVLRHYVVYRAMVRAKVAALRLQQLDGDGERQASETQAALASLRQYLDLAAATAAAPSTPIMVISFGLSGSGKSWVARRVAPQLGGVCIRSDVERARLYPPGPGRYSGDATQRTYARMGALAGSVLGAGYPVILDATFLESARREEMLALAGRLGVPARILALEAPRAVLESRITARLGQGTDASEADLGVLARQLQTLQRLSQAELEMTVHVDTTEEHSAAELAARLTPSR